MKTEFAKQDSRAFNILEFLVVIAVLAVLAAVIFSAIASGKERAKRSQCLNNLRQVGVVSLSYAHDNNDLFYPSKHATTNDSDGFVPNALNNVPEATVKRLCLERTSEAPSIWACPNRFGLPVFEKQLVNRGRSTSLNQWVLGYAYFGGVTNWYNQAFTNWIPSRSPVSIADSKPNWVLAADTVLRVNGKWGDNAEGDRPRPIYWNLPPHHGATGNRPTGGNELFADGSVQWINFDKMFFLTTWKGQERDHQFFYYQDPEDFDPKLLEHLPELSAKNFK